jgi:hypothetical protein
LQASFQRVARRAGLLATIAVTSAVYVGSGPPSLVVVMAIAAVIFGFGVDRSGSALGALGGRIGLVLAAGFGGPLLIGAVGIVEVHFPRWRGWEGTAALVIWLLLAPLSPFGERRAARAEAGRFVDAQRDRSSDLCAFADEREELTLRAVEAVLAQQPAPAEVIVVVDHNERSASSFAAVCRSR